MKAFALNLAVNLVLLAIVLASAGRIDWWPAWIYAAIGLLTNVLMRRVLGRHPELARERARPGAGSAAWDKRLLGIGFLLTLAMLVVAGLDARFGWSGRVAPVWAVAGVLLCLAGMTLFLRAMRANPFFSAVVRIQGERGHTPCSAGPYRIVRHPGNAGMMLGTLGFPLLFLSAWSAIPALLAILVLVVRTQLEDAFLAHGLLGYRDYQRTTRFRLVPGIW